MKILLSNDDGGYAPGLKALYDALKNNVNILDLAYHDLKGYQITRLGSRYKAQNMIKIKDPRGKIGHWIGLAGDPLYACIFI